MSVNKSLVVTGSIAYDYLMSFPGTFTEHFLPEHMQRISLSFLVDTMDKRRGGCAPNIAYTLALLGERPLLMATAGEDFGEYRRWLEAAGVDTALTKQIDGKFCASFFCSTDRDNNQIASFYTGAMADAGQLSFRTIRDCRLAIIAPNDPGAMVQYAEECRALGIPFIFDPGQQCARMEGTDLADGVRGATVVIVNDYELELLRQKTGMGERDLLNAARTLIVTRGEAGSTVITSDRPVLDTRERNSASASGVGVGPHALKRIDIAAVTPTRIVDPTGVGDAFRGGLMKGIALDLPYDVSAQMGSVAATYALEHLGGQSHAYTWDAFQERYERHFGALTIPR